MFVYLSKKISIPNNVQLKYVAWCFTEGFIACGGDEGLLKVLKLEASASGREKGLAATSNLSINQNLEGHSGAVQVIVWNEVHQKLTTSDQYGLIIVWMMYKGSWYEEMINNRNKSVVSDMSWSSDGTKICIVYEDGVVIVGSVDGNRLWGKEIKGTLAAVEWSPSCRKLLFGFSTGEVNSYDNEGNFVSKVNINCLQGEEGTIIGIKWFSRYWSRPEGNPEGEPRPPPTPDPTLYSLAIIYQHGALQLMRHENDNEMIVIQQEKLKFISAKWNQAGTTLAIAAKQLDLPEGEQNLVLFISNLGENLRSLKVPGNSLAACSWEAGGLRVCLAVDSHIFFANIRPSYKWGYCGETIVYSYRKPDRPEDYVSFWDVKLEEVFTKHVKDLISIASRGDYCALINKADDPSGQYLLQICNGIGTPVDFKYVDIQPVHVTMNRTHLIVASKNAFYLWQFHVPRSSGRDLLHNISKRNVAGEILYHIDEIVTEHSEPAGDAKKAQSKTLDPIAAICSTDKCFFIGRESGVVHKYSLPNAVLLQKYSLGSRPETLAANFTNTRLASVSHLGVLHLYDIEGSVAKLVQGMERKDVWNVQWDEDNDQMFAIMEKTRLFVLRGITAEEPVSNSGYICRFKDLTVRTVLLDELVNDPDNPDPEWVVDVEIKSLRDAKALLEKISNIQEASAFIEANSHPKLWSLLSEVALSNMETATAEHAFVKLKDYGGIRFIKKVNNIQNEKLKKAEIAAYFGRFDEAEKIYMDNDRRDLALSLRRKVHDWFKILQLLQTGAGAGDDVLMQEAWNHVGDYFADRQKWSQAERHYEPGRNQEMLTKCYTMNEDYDKLETLMRSLPENHKLLPEIGDMFANSGLSDQAVEAYKKCHQVKQAIDTCINLNQWETAVSLAKSYDVQDIDHLLSKYATQLTGDADKILTAVQLYRKAGRYLDAAKLIYQIADDEKERQAGPLRLKKLHVLAALLIEQFHEQNKAKAGAQKGNKKLEAQAALSGLLAEDSRSAMDSKIIDNAWKGAEAYHFYMLAQKQLYDGQLDQAMKTALHLTEYDDVIDPVEVHSLLALVSCANRQFAVCSRAFIKLESLETLSAEEREAYQNLSLNIFTKNNPKDNRSNKAECTGCETLIPDYCQVCPSCDTKFPTCIVTGRPLMDYQFWLCPVCKHRAYEQEIQTHKFCPLCHVPI